jgi:hypothetical protein
MNERPKQTLESVWLVAIVMVASFVALVAMGVATPATAASAFDAQSAGKIVVAARSAMAASGAVQAIGTGQLTVPGVGPAVANETNYSGPNSGTQVVAMTSKASTSAGQLPAASISLVNSDLYIDANAPFWTGSVGLTAAQAPTVADKWVEIPSTSPVYAPVAADMSMPSLVKDMFDATKFHKGTVRTVHGVRVVPISFTNGGYDSGPATVYVSAGGKHLPVSAAISGVTLRFSQWGTKKTVTAPAGAVPLPDLPSPSSGTPVIA